MSYVSPALQSRFESLSIDLKNEILSRNVTLNSLQDLIEVLQQIVDEGEAPPNRGGFVPWHSPRRPRGFPSPSPCEKGALRMEKPLRQPLGRDMYIMPSAQPSYHGKPAPGSRSGGGF